MPKPKRNRLHDWFFGGPGKRLMICALMDRPGPWSESALARAAELRRGSAAPHLHVLERAGAVSHKDGRFYLLPDSDVAAALKTLVEALEAVPDEEL